MLFFHLENPFLHIDYLHMMVYNHLFLLEIQNFLCILYKIYYRDFLRLSLLFLIGVFFRRDHIMILGNDILLFLLFFLSHLLILGFRFLFLLLFLFLLRFLFLLPFLFLLFYFVLLFFLILGLLDFWIFFLLVLLILV